MQNFINFFIEKFDKIVFLIFLIISFSLILNRNFFQNSKINFFSNGIISSINNQTKEINNYLNLKFENANLKRENLDLKIKLNSAFKDSSINYYNGEYKIKIADIIESRLESFAEAESLDNGKPVSLASHVETTLAGLRPIFFS